MSVTYASPQKAIAAGIPDLCPARISHAAGQRSAAPAPDEGAYVAGQALILGDGLTRTETGPAPEPTPRSSR